MSSRLTIWPSFFFLAIAGGTLLLPDPLGLNPLLWACVAVLVVDLLWRVWKNWRALRRSGSTE